MVSIGEDVLPTIKTTRKFFSNWMLLRLRLYFIPALLPFSLCCWNIKLLRSSIPRINFLFVNCSETYNIKNDHDDSKEVAENGMIAFIWFFDAERHLSCFAKAHSLCNVACRSWFVLWLLLRLTPCTRVCVCLVVCKPSSLRHPAAKHWKAFFPST